MRTASRTLGLMVLSLALSSGLRAIDFNLSSSLSTGDQGYRESYVGAELGRGLFFGVDGYGYGAKFLKEPVTRLQPYISYVGDDEPYRVSLIGDIVEPSDGYRRAGGIFKGSYRFRGNVVLGMGLVARNHMDKVDAMGNTSKAERTISENQIRVRLQHEQYLSPRWSSWSELSYRKASYDSLDAAARMPRVPEEEVFGFVDQRYMLEAGLLFYPNIVGEHASSETVYPRIDPTLFVEAGQMALTGDSFTRVGGRIILRMSHMDFGFYASSLSTLSLSSSVIYGASLGVNL